MANKEEKQMVNCLRNERIIVRHIPKYSSKIQNPKHVFYEGMAENATRTFVVPRLTSGVFVNVLTNSEKEFLENIMGLETNALSIHKKEHNFWSDANPDGISKVVLRRQDTYLDLSNPNDYIRYKILLANKDLICPSLEEYERMPKVTYQFVIIKEGDETKAAKSATDNMMESYKEFGKIEDNIETLRVVVETLGGRPVAQTSKIEFLQAKVNEFIQSDAKKFLKVVKDEYLPIKVLIRQAIQSGVITKRGDFLYLRSDGKPLCNDNEDPTLDVAARFLSDPRHQTIKFSIESEVNPK